MSLLPIHRLGLVCLLLVTVLAGCGTQASAGRTPTLTIWYSTDDPVERGWSEELVRPFQASHPQVQVHFVPLSFEDMNTKLQLALSAGNPPDLAYVTPRGPGIPAYLGAHRLLDLTAAARADGWGAKLRPGLLTEYNRPFAHYGGPAGHVMAVPTGLAAVGVLYNQALLNRLHLQLPTTLAAFRSALARARAAGYVPIGIGNADGWLGDDWYLTLVNALVGPSALAPEQALDPRFSFLRPQFIDAGHTLQSWSNAGYLTPDFGGLDAQEGVQEFFKGRTLFQLVSSSENAQILQLQRSTRLPVGIFAFPASGGAPVMPVSGYLGWVVPRASAHADLAIDFINSLLTPATTSFLLTHGVLPATRAQPAAAAAGWQRQYLQALNESRAGVYLDAAPIANMNATMEANVQLLLQGYEAATFLVQSLEKVYRGKGGSTARIDGEF